MFGHQLTAKLSLDVKTSGVQIRWNKEPEEKGKKKGLQWQWSVDRGGGVSETQVEEVQ